MKSNAPGQLLGYTIQFPRALSHLLKSGPGDSVCVEVLGDVASIDADGIVPDEEIELTEEDYNNDVDPQINKALEILN